MNDAPVPSISEYWIDVFEKDIAELKEKGRHNYYQFSLAMSKETADAIKKHFSKKEGFSIIVNMCPKKLYDFIISF